MSEIKCMHFEYLLRNIFEKKHLKTFYDGIIYIPHWRFIVLISAPWTNMDFYITVKLISSKKYIKNIMLSVYIDININIYVQSQLDFLKFLYNLKLFS